MRRFLHLVIALALIPAACDDTTGIEDAEAPVSIQFGTAGSTTANSIAPANVSGLAANLTDDELRVDGSNGRLILSDIRLIVAEFELEAQEGACDTTTGQEDDEDCPDFEAPPAFVDLPLGMGTVNVATDRIPFGTYTGLEFEVEDVSLDEDDEDEGKLETLRNEVRAAFPNWPDEASMVVVGSFDPDTTVAGDERPFTVFFEAEIEVEKEFATPLVVDETGTSHAVTVEIAPEVWFTQSDGSLLDLSQFDFETTGEVVEFEMEFESGVDADSDDDDEDDDD